MNFKKWVKSIQTAGYNGARTLDASGLISGMLAWLLDILIGKSALCDQLKCLETRTDTSGFRTCM